MKHVIVMGHYGCGGVKAAMTNIPHGLIDKVLSISLHSSLLLCSFALFFSVLQDYSFVFFSFLFAFRLFTFFFFLLG